MKPPKPLRRRRSIHWILIPSAVLTVLGFVLATAFPQYGSVIVGVGISGALLAVVVLGMSVLGSRRGRGETLRSAP